MDSNRLEIKADGEGMLMQVMLGLVTLGLGGILTLVAATKYPAIRWALAIAFLLRASAALTHAFVTPLPDSQLDASTFERVGWEWSQAGWPGVLEHFVTGAYLYSWFIAVLYSITERSPLMIQSLNVMLGTISVLLVYLIATKIGASDRGARRATWVAALFPTLVLYSAITMREAFIGASFLYGIYSTVLWWRNWSVFAFSKAALSFFSASVLHSGILPALALLGTLTFGRWSRALRARNPAILMKWAVATVGVLALGVFIVVTGVGLEYIGNVQAHDLAAHQQNQASGRAAYLEGLLTQSPFDYIWQTPIRVVFFLFSPFLWQVRSPLDLFGLLDAGLYAWLSYSIWKARKSHRGNALVGILLLFLVAEVVTFALTTSNYGTGIRHRAKFAPLMIALYAMAQHNRISWAARSVES